MHILSLLSTNEEENKAATFYHKAPLQTAASTIDKYHTNVTAANLQLIL